ncbi:MAG: 2Fe-2S iron-sulfur cluster binding domain-containing protein [Rhodocyclaceae bacterium]|nr:2Fe-2S iron-sulfur cluster binding domain-containing protein [Rhodocyclaceae bacterium]
MPAIEFEGQALHCRDGESVLDALLRRGMNVPFSCKRGVCHVCIQRCLEGIPPAAARAGLRPSLIEGGYFMPCMCVPESGLRIARPDNATLFRSALVVAKEMLAPAVYRLVLEPAAELSFRPGQFINLRRADGIVRSYSPAGLPEDFLLELHVRRYANGALSRWIADELAAGDEVEISGPEGDCVLPDAPQERRLVLIGSGTGLAPLLGLVREALQRGGAAPIHLYHFARTGAGHYLHATLQDLQARHARLNYRACLPAGPEREDLLDAWEALARRAFCAGLTPEKSDVFIAGHPEFVDAMHQRALGAGVAPGAIHTDPFLLRELRKAPRPAAPAPARQAARPDAGASLAKDPPPDPELWTALADGELLQDILRDFYARVFDDPRLAPFFHATTRQRAIEKQFLFLRQVFTGEKIYFGDRPRNAHHWMVISDELFDYRARLIAQCMREHGLAERYVERWLAIEEFYRAHVVKAEPVARIMNGVALPLDGFGVTTLDCGTLCDTCGREIQVGETVRYHLRTGSTYCSDCMGAHPPAAA